MKRHSTMIIAALALTTAALILNAQDAGNPPADRPPHRGPGPGGAPGGAGPDGQRRPPPPIIAALDANHDGVIDEQEIANASAALLTLDKNGDGKLTIDELRPPPPQGAEQRGPGPQGFRAPYPNQQGGEDNNVARPRRPAADQQ